MKNKQNRKFVEYNKNKIPRKKEIHEGVTGEVVIRIDKPC